MQVATPLYRWMAAFFTLVYFLFFILMPFYTSTDNDKPVPDRVHYP
jgi:ubiquinol-cytochrome c reductase cytochrome b subunit